MKGLMKGRAKRLLSAVLALAVVAGLTTSVYAASGPNRPTRAWSVNENGFEYVTFNSFTGVPNGVGDERDFHRGVVVGRDNVWSDPVNNITSGVEVEAKIYIHNNADPALNDQPGAPGVAKNVNVRVALPTGEQLSQDMTAYISASNANPGTVYDTLTMNGAANSPFAVEFVPGSAKLHQGGTATALSDSLVTSGVALADIPGCFEYIREITYRVKVKVPSYTVKKQITTPGSTDWKDTMNAKPGDTVSWLITFNNVGHTELKDVKIVDEVPLGLTVVPGSVKLVNTNFPQGWAYPDTAIQANGRQINVDIGTYPAGSGAYVTFRTKVADAAELKCGENKIVNKAFATPKDHGAVTDTADVNVPKECKDVPPENCPLPGKEKLPKNSPDCKEVPKELPKTGAGSVAGIIAATTVAGTVAHNAVTRRKNLR